MRDPAVTAFFAEHPRLRLAALGHAGNFVRLDLCPLGIPAEARDAAGEPALVARYHAANAARFGGPLALPGWVLVDLYLLPGAISLILDRDDEIVAAWCGVPTVTPGVVMGVSLLSLQEGIGAAYASKRCGVAMLRAEIQRGVTQWDSPSLRSHTRLGPLRVLGPVPAAHGEAARSFVYECAIGAAAPAPSTWIAPPEGPAFAARAAAGEAIWVVAPGVAAGRVALRVTK
ncbi:MAG: hypothetical protein EXR71_02785 [Myxococcales bacterium]|nr:hypothetical protein [Myxococcales bacterium]